MRSDFGRLLAEMGGWEVGCDNESRHSGALDHAMARGYVTLGQHWARDLGKMVPAYELTDDGLEQVRKLCGEKTARHVEKNRTFYREKAAERAAPKQ